MNRKFKHFFRHEWVRSDISFNDGRIQEQRCVYPGCSYISIYDREFKIRFGIRNMKGF